LERVFCFSEPLYLADIRNTMKRTLLFCGLTAILLSCGQNADEKAPAVQTEEPTTLNEQFDQKLADKLGADEYGMKRYVMAFLKMGPNRDQDSVKAMELQRAHLDNINRLAKAGKLVVAGPFLDAGDIRGIYIFNVETIEEAEALTKTDPAIQAGRLVMELHPWYGSAALMECAAMHKKVAKSEI
jgi:uncharacterized protein